MRPPVDAHDENCVKQASLVFNLEHKMFHVIATIDSRILHQAMQPFSLSFAMGIFSNSLFKMIVI